MKRAILAGVALATLAGLATLPRDPPYSADELPLLNRRRRNYLRLSLRRE